MNSVVDQVTQSIVKRSRLSRRHYLEQLALQKKSNRGQLGPTNLAHGFASSNEDERLILKNKSGVQNIAIVSAYNDMVSAHQPYAHYPRQIKSALKEQGAIAQVAGGVPAMCDGITQGYEGMELSLFSRDVIAQATAVSLSHQMYDGVILLGTCDKIMPGLLMGALQFGHLPALFIPSGPMTSGQSNEQKALIRQRFAEGKINSAQLLESEQRAYHSPGTCTFYGTANTNQLLLEVMGLQLPGSTFLNPDTPLREKLNHTAARQILRLTQCSDNHTPLGLQINEKNLVNAIVALLATGGSTNLTIHLIAIARCAGIEINWQDFSELSTCVPLLTKIYPNGEADINQFEAAGGVGIIIQSLLNANLLHRDTQTLLGAGIETLLKRPTLDAKHQLDWKNLPESTLNDQIIASTDSAFSENGGLKLVSGNLGRAIIKVSAVKPEHRKIKAQALVFNNQNEVLRAFKAGELERDFIAVVRFQGPRANGMPELHKLTPSLSSLQSRGFSVALITDGRMSGASGTILAAIHISPEASDGGMLSKVQNGDLIEIDALSGTLELQVKPEILLKRESQTFNAPLFYNAGQTLFNNARRNVSSAETGALSLF
ncbi:MAG: phosphogluconate dehydratase [Gammaproteobacteria bacterium]|nr:phosphogluconate dehydratase [Gammaproteobacteria bacterium]